MKIDEIGEYLVLKGFSEMDSSRFKRGNVTVNLGVRGNISNWSLSESGSVKSTGSGLDSLIEAVKSVK